MRKHFYYVYIMASRSGVVYVGVTNNLAYRVHQHKTGQTAGFTKKYHCTKLVYFEETDEIGAAITREKELKKWRRAKKSNLIHTMNPQWQDLGEEIT